MQRTQFSSVQPPQPSSPSPAATDERSDTSDTKDPANLYSTFIQNTSHELRTPLSIIQGYAELLHNGKLGPLTPVQQRAVSIISGQAYELRTMVEHIGTLMAIETHASVSLPLRLVEVAARVVEEKRATATQARLTLEAHFESDLPLVLGDPHHLRQAIEHLVENAIKFTPDGGRVEVQVYTEPGWVCLAVTDTGIGIPEEEMEHIFTGFYQIDGSTTRHYRGIGLGLTVLRALLEEHAGRVEVESQPGQGSRFVIKLPALPDAAQARQPTRKDEGDTELRRILIVDDEEIVALGLQGGLEMLSDCEVAIATDGEEALRLFEQQAFDLLITDYRMPGTDGMTLATRIRQLYPQTAIIMITAYASNALREQAARVAIHRVMDKPVKLAEIRSAALEALVEDGLIQ